MLLLIILSEERLVKGCKHLVIRWISLVDLMYNMVTIVNLKEVTGIARNQGPHRLCSWNGHKSRGWRITCAEPLWVLVHPVGNGKPTEDGEAEDEEVSG